MANGDDFAARLKAERSRLGLSQIELAERIGVGRSSQKAYENGTTFPTADYLLKARALGVDVVFLLTGTGTSDELPRDEHQMLCAYRLLGNEQREAVVRLVEVMNPRSASV